MVVKTWCLGKKRWQF